MLIKEAIRDYLCARRIEGCTIATMENRAYRLALLQRYFSKRRINRVVEVRAQDIDDYSANLNGRGVSQRTRAAYLSTIRVFFQWLQERGKLLVNPARDVVIPTRNEEPLPEQPLTEAEMASILDGMPRRSVSDLRNRLHLELLYGCGLRLTESIKLKIADVDMEHRSLRIAGKGGKVRVLPLMKGTLGALKDYLALRRSLLKGPDDGTLLIGKTTGSALSGVMVPAILRRVAKRAGFKRRLHAHLFRHSIAVHLLQRGADIRHVQEFLGHASIDTTKIYLRMVPGRLKEDYDKAMPGIAIPMHV